VAVGTVAAAAVVKVAAAGTVMATMH